MRINVSGLDKVKVLVALYENAKKSEKTEATQASIMGYGDTLFIYRHFIGEIRAKLAEITLSENEARAILAQNVFIDYIGPVCIKMLFEGNEIDTRQYDEANFQHGRAVKTAEVVIDSLRPASLSSSSYVSPSAASSSFSSLAGSSSKELELSVQEKIQRLLNVSCRFVNSAYLGMSIKTEETDLTTLQGYSDLLKKGGISTEVQCGSKISSTIMPAKLKVRSDETLESLDEKLVQLQAMIETRAADATSEQRSGCSL